MTIQTPVFVSTQPDDGKGDKLRDAFIKINERFQDIAALFQNKGDWATGTEYEPRDYIIEGGEAYVCTIAHTGGVFADDLASGKWASVDALDLRADLASDAEGKGSALVAFKQSGTGAVARTVAEALNSGVIYIQRAGAVGDGITDDTAIATAVHVYANSIGAAVSYAGMNKIALQANAQIPMKTSTEFAGCELVIMGGVAESPSFSTFNELYVVSDDDCPLVTVTGAVSALDLGQGGLFPTRGLFNGHGFARIECGYQVPNRYKNGTVNYQQSFKVNRNGRASQPLSVDISAHAAAITVNYRKTSKKRLKISNVALTEGAWNNQRVFKIQRCNVHMENVSVLFEGESPFDNVCELISIVDASDISIDGLITTGRPVTLSVGSYCLAINGGADIFIDEMNALTGWGATGCNHVNGVYYTRSVLNRIDAHQGGHNVFVNNCDLHETGVVYGWGGGLMSVKNSRLIECPAIKTRNDYGGTFFGDIVVSDCEVVNTLIAGYFLVDLTTNGGLGASSPVYAPNSISVASVKRMAKPNGTNAEFIPVAVKVRGAEDIVYAPVAVTVQNITSHHNWRLGMRLDLLNMEANPLTTTTRIVLSDVYPSQLASSTTGILDYASIRTPTIPVRPFFAIADCDNVHLRCMTPINLVINFSNCGVNAVMVDTASVTPANIQLKNCRILNGASGYTNPPIGGSNSGNNNYTSLIGCEIGAIEYDLTLASSFIGCTVRKGTLSPLLPPGVTNDLIFSGWRKPFAFA